MDNVCHTLAGAAFGRAGLASRTRFGTATLMIAANIPDLDVLVFATSMPAVAFRRGWTHGVLAQALLPVALALVVAGIGRLRRASATGPPLSLPWLIALSYVGVISRVLMDLLNNYGIRLLAPLDWTWFYGDSVFIIDPWLWLTLGLGLWIGRRMRRPHTAARVALVVVLVYVEAMVASSRAARAHVINVWQQRYGAPPPALMVGPVPVTPFTRHVIVDAGNHYETGTFSWFPMRVTFDEAMIPKNDDDPRVVRARAAPNIRAFLVWSRFPFWTLESVQGGTRVSVSDMRFITRGGGFTQSVVVPDLIANPD